MRPAPPKRKSRRPKTRRLVISRAHVSRSSSRPHAWAPPTSAPMEVPAMTSGAMPAATRRRTTPMCAQPRAAPPPSASPIVGLAAFGSCRSTGSASISASRFRFQARNTTFTPRAVPAQRRAHRQFQTLAGNRDEFASTFVTVYERGRDRGIRLAAERQPPVEARAAAGMAGGAGARDVNLHDEGVLIAVDQEVDNLEAVAGRRAFLPQLLARARPEPGGALLDGAGERLLVHVREHEHGAVGGVGDDARNQAAFVEARREAHAVLKVAAGKGKAGHDKLLPAIAGRSVITCRSMELKRQRLLAWTSLKKRTCSAGSSRNTPVNWVVTVETPCFITPRMAMHRCSASIITAAPRGFRFSSIAFRICEVRCSWVCRRRANTSITRAIFDRPTTRPTGK